MTALSSVEALLVPWYTDQLGVRVVTETPSDLQAQVPLVQLAIVGGSADSALPERLRLVRWVLHSYAIGMPAAAALAERAHTLTLTTLRGAMLPGAVVSSTDEDSSPAWVPYPDTQLRQYAASYHALLLVG